MAKKRREFAFQHVQTTGPMLPTDVLQRVANEDTKLPGLKAADYQLAPNERLGEAITRSWTRLLDIHKSFSDELATSEMSDTAAAPTFKLWLRYLFQELGYGTLTATPAARTIDDATFPISHQWNHLPIHLVGANVPLDRRTSGVTGASRSAPHSLAQEFINRTDESLWAIVSNGRQLRLVRDNVSMTRQAFVEFDLEGMFKGQSFADFRLLWLVLHSSRFDVPADGQPHQCLIEQWHVEGATVGTRVLGELSVGVKAAIESLGRGFLAHPANDELRGALADGTLGKQEYYRQLLRLVYRLLFLFVSESRRLLLNPQASRQTVDLYDKHYSASRLQRMAGILRGNRHRDLYESLKLVMRALGGPDDCPQLGIVALGGYLWSEKAIGSLGTSALSNQAILAAVRSLSFITDKDGRRPVDYRNLGSEELGGVYEQLLELHPEINPTAVSTDKRFVLEVSAGNERKTSGSHYTPESLVQVCLDTALEPLLNERLAGKKGPEAEKVILALKVVDTAVGSGHFLIGAAHRMAKRLAAVRTGDTEPSPEAYRTALRDVIRSCLYGVDLNPMAAELCRVALWLESMEPGKPLSFLDHHIKIGNSLLGATPALMANGIPDDAFDAIEGDDKKLCTQYRKANKREREDARNRQQSLFGQPIKLGNLTSVYSSLTSLPDDSLEQVEAKRRQYESLVGSSDYLSGRLLADAWCAAFVWKKTGEFDYPVTEEVYRQIEVNPRSQPGWMVDEIRQLSRQYQFFHWHLEFPDVFRVPAESEKPENEQMGWSGGFDCVLGNPPWDTLSPDVREFFGQWIHNIRSLAPVEQEAAISELRGDATISDAWQTHCRELFGKVHLLKNSGVFTLYAPGNLGKGDFNTYRMFAELAARLSLANGFFSLIVPAGLYGGANGSALRRHFMDKCQLRHLFGLINTSRGWFRDVDMDRFCAFAVRNSGRTTTFNVQFGLAGPHDLGQPPVIIDADVIRDAAPDTYAIPDVRNFAAFALSQKMYAACPAFGADASTALTRHYSRELDMGNDRHLFTSKPAGLPVYEGRMIDQYDHRAKTYTSGHGNTAKWEERSFGDALKSIMPQWRVLPHQIPSKLGDRCSRYRIGFGDVANPRNQRSFVATIIPPGNICGHKVPTLDFGSGNEWMYCPFLTIANSISMDWLARTKLTSPQMAFSLLDNLPFPQPTEWDALMVFCVERVLGLVCTSPEMTAYWNYMARRGAVTPVAADSVPNAALLTENTRALVRAELDGFVAKHVFGITRDDLDMQLMTFDALRRREESEYGEYRTRRLVLEAFSMI